MSGGEENVLAPGSDASPRRQELQMNRDFKWMLGLIAVGVAVALYSSQCAQLSKTCAVKPTKTCQLLAKYIAPR